MLTFSCRNPWVIEVEEKIRKATITFSDGVVFMGQVNLVTSIDGDKGWLGTFRSDQALHILSKQGRPILVFDRQRWQVLVFSSSVKGCVTIQTSGPPLM